MVYPISHILSSLGVPHTTDMYPFELKKRRNAICHDVTAEQVGAF